MLWMDFAHAADSACTEWEPSQLVTNVGEMPPTESSGLAVASGAFLTIADAGGDASMYRFDATGELLATVPVDGATNTDWEDLAVTPCDEGSCTWIADIGDNDENRASVTIWRAPITNQMSFAGAACVVRYEDGPQDAEALLAFPDGSFRIVTKDPDVADVYYIESLACDGSTNVFVKETELVLGASVTGGSVSADGSLVALRSLDVGWVFGGCALDWAATPVDLLFVGETQGESVAFAEDGTLWSSSEGETFELHQLECVTAETLECDECACGSGATGGWVTSFAAAWTAARRRRGRR